VPLRLDRPRTSSGNRALRAKIKRTREFLRPKKEEDISRKSHISRDRLLSFGIVLPNSVVKTEAEIRKKQIIRFEMRAVNKESEFDGDLTSNNNTTNSNSNSNNHIRLPTNSESSNTMKSFALPAHLKSRRRKDSIQNVLFKNSKESEQKTLNNINNRSSAADYRSLTDLGDKEESYDNENSIESDIDAKPVKEMSNLLMSTSTEEAPSSKPTQKATPKTGSVSVEQPDALPEVIKEEPARPVEVEIALPIPEEIPIIASISENTDVEPVTHAVEEQADDMNPILVETEAIPTDDPNLSDELPSNEMVESVQETPKPLSSLHTPILNKETPVYSAKSSAKPQTKEETRNPSRITTETPIKSAKIEEPASRSKSRPTEHVTPLETPKETSRLSSVEDRVNNAHSKPVRVPISREKITPVQSRHERKSVTKRAESVKILEQSSLRESEYDLAYSQLLEQDTDIKNKLMTLLNTHWFPGLSGKELTIPNIIEVLHKLMRHGLWKEKCEASKAALYLFKIFEGDIPIPKETIIYPQLEIMDDPNDNFREQLCKNLGQYNLYDNFILYALICKLNDESPAVR
jgi:hypothetical protein